MGYHLTSEAENAVPENPLASPKTHTPLPQVEKRGFRSLTGIVVHPKDSAMPLPLSRPKMCHLIFREVP